MALEFNGGVVIAADSRTTSGFVLLFSSQFKTKSCAKLNKYSLIVYSRAYIVNRVTDKLTPLTDKIFCLRSGSAADTQAIADFVKYNLEFHEYGQ
jgi:20S proteasome subunit beta 1